MAMASRSFSKRSYVDGTQQLTVNNFFHSTDAPSLALSEIGDGDGGRDTAGIQAESSAIATKAAVSASVAAGLCMALL